MVCALAIILIIIYSVLPCMSETFVITTIAGNGGTGANDGDNVAATSSSLSSPVGVSLDASGNVYAVERGNNRVRKITVSNGIITSIAGTGVYGHTGDGGVATSAALCDPLGLEVDSSGMSAPYYYTLRAHIHPSLTRQRILHRALMFLHP